MKLLPFFAIVLVYLNCYSQQDVFQLEGMVVDSASQPVADAYIINLRSYEKSVSKQNGVFGMKVLPGDSLVITHISYNRKMISVFSLMKDPVIVLEEENLNIGQVDVSPNHRSAYVQAMKNIASIDDIKFYNDPKINMEPELSMQMMREQNNYLRSEATSVRILRFSPSEKIKKIIRKLKRKNEK
jgi:hypothetical protein